MKIAIYSRKSKFTGKGESIENQIELCKDYIVSHYPNVEDGDIEVFEDEGFSAKNLDRPQFQVMISKVRTGKFDYIICYRLDRISRNVSDFSSLIEELNVRKVSFVCIKEQFDTSTPMGRAMMYIASVFAQLERETIAERVRDNMYMLARTGRWLGGITPLGFESEKIETITLDDKKRSAYNLKPIQEDINLAKLIFSKFLEYQSLSGTEKYLIQHDIKSKRGSYFTKLSIKNIITHPVYCVADEASFNYMSNNLKCQMFCTIDDCNGKYGFTTYNRTSTESGKKQSRNDESQWIIAIGKHKGIISSQDWIKANKIIENNKPYAEYRKVHNSTALLSGLLKCAECNSFMRPKVVSYYKHVGEEPVFNYMCEMKEKSRKTKCNCPNVSGNSLDELVCSEILKYNKPKSAVGKQLDSIKSNLNNLSKTNADSIDIINKTIAEKESMIQNLVLSLTKANSDNVIFYIQQEIDKLDRQLQELKKDREHVMSAVDLDSLIRQQFLSIEQALEKFGTDFKNASIPEKRSQLRQAVKRITWDGENINIFLIGAPD